MKRCAPLDHGAPGWHLLSRRGFTLLEMCTVLFIIMLLLAAALPSIQTAFIEKSVRDDSHELALMVKTAMLQSADEHRPYTIDFTRTTMTLHPVSDPSQNGEAKDGNAAGGNPASDDSAITYAIDGADHLQLPDPEKPKAWLPVLSASWLFRPGELCPAPRVRFIRGDAWLELSFNALTGNVENEDSYFP